MSPATDVDDAPEAMEKTFTTFLFKKHFTDFIVVEKFDDKLCGTWPTDLLKPYVECKQEVIQPSAPECLTTLVREEIGKIIAAKDGKYLISLSAENNTKEIRKALHIYIRDHYDNALSTFSVDEGVEVSFVNNPKKVDRRVQWPEGLGKFLHFTLKKTDHENSHALNCIARSMNATSKLFQFAGSKDRRAVTYQRLSAFKVYDSKLVKADGYLKRQGIELSEFSYEDTQISLGSHTSNIFYIILRNAEIDEARFQTVKEHGCFNIFGPQRFGSVSGNTASIGNYILHDQYEEAVNAVLDPELCGHAQLRDILRQYAVANDASVIRNVPLYMSKFNEIILIRSLGKFDKQADKYLQALLQLPRHVRSLYVHAYQSKIFNQFIDSYKEKHPIEVCPDISVPLPHSSVTAEEYPEVFEAYTALLAKDGLTLASFEKHDANFALHSAMRNILLKPKSMTFQRLEHSDPDALFTFYPPSNEERDYGKGHKSILISFELSPGGYATTILTAVFDREFKTGATETI